MKTHLELNMSFDNYINQPKLAAEKVIVVHDMSYDEFIDILYYYLSDNNEYICNDLDIYKSIFSTFIKDEEIVFYPLIDDDDDYYSDIISFYNEVYYTIRQNIKKPCSLMAIASFIFIECCSIEIKEFITIKFEKDNYLSSWLYNKYLYKNNI